MQVHAQKLRREQPGLVAARARAHLQHGVFVVVRVLGQQRDARLLGLVRKALPQLHKLLLRHLPHVGVGQQLLGGGDLLPQAAVLHGDGVQLLQIGVLTDQPRKQRAVRDDLGQRDADGQLLKAALDALQLACNALLRVVRKFRHRFKSLLMVDVNCSAPRRCARFH